MYTTVATHSTSAQSPHDGEPAQRRVRGRGMRKREAVVDMPPAPPPPSPAPQQQQQPPQQLQQQTNAAGKQTVQTPRQEASSSDRAAAPRRGRRGRRRLSARTSGDDTATAAPPPAVTRTTPQTSNKNDGDKATTASRKAAPTARRTCDDAAIDAAVAAALAHAPQQQQQQRPVAAARASPPPPPLQQQSTSPPPPPPAKMAATTAMRAAAAALPRNACARIQEHIRRKRLLLQRQKEQQKQQQAQASAPAAAAAAATSASGGATAASSRHSPLFFPDYRERVLDVFEQLAEINTALGERYKAQSYQTARERLRRGDTVFRVLPPNLVPLSPAQEQQLQQQAAAATATSESEAVRDVLAKRAYVQIPTNALPGVGDKLRRKILEILRTGDLAELHVLQAKPIIRAVRELTQMHGFGPRTAVTIYKTYGISTVAELKRYVAEHSDGGDGSDKGKGKSGGAGAGGKVLRLTDAQRVGLQYHDEIVQRMPHDEGRLHEAFLKLRVRKYLGKAYMLTVCGSYRRGTPDSGDIDVLLTRRPESSSNDNNTASSSGSSSSSSSSSATTTTTTPAASGVDDTTVLRRFVDALTAEGYMEATLAQGPTKFMGVCRLRSHNSNNNEGSSGSNSKAAARRFVARRIDIRFVDALSYPAALLYFTGSKNFNVIMRAEAIKRHFVLNEYGLFRNPHSQGTRDADGTGKLHDMITRLARAQFYSSSAAAWGGGSDAAAAAAAAAQTASDGAEDDDDDGGAHTTRRKPRGGGGGGKSVTVEQVRELRELARQVEALRVRVSCEQDIFATIGMSYVTPHDRSL